MKREEIVALLKDEEIKRLIKDIYLFIKEPKAKQEHKSIVSPEIVEKYKEKIKSLEEKNAQLSLKNKELNTHIEELKQHKLKLEQQLDLVQKNYNQLAGKLKEKDTEIEVLKKEFTTLKEDKKELEEKNRYLEEQLDFYKHNFKDWVEVYEQFQTLSEVSKKSLQGIFKDNTLQGFIACGLQEKNLESLWDYIRKEIIEEKNSDLEQLIYIFNFLFDKMRYAYPFYERQKVKIGDNFSPDRHIKDSRSSSGTIKKILLDGWINQKNDRIIKKAVVYVE